MTIEQNMSPSIVEHFDELARDWDDSFSHPKTSVIKNLLEQIDLSDNIILDVASGTGVLLPFLLNRNPKKIDELDISANMLSIASEKYKEEKDINYLNEDLLELDSENAYDFIICYNSFPHFLERENFFKKCRKLLKPEGRILVFHDQDAEGINRIHVNAGMIDRNLARRLNSLEEERGYFKNYFELLNIDTSDCFVLYGKK